jgi:hypothetical protein
MKEFRERYGDFVVAYHPNPVSSWQYVNVGSPDYKLLLGRDKTPNHRYIFPDELVLDVDVDDKKLQEESVKELIIKLNTLKLKFSLWKTYQKHHFHLWFPEIKDLDTNIRSDIKYELINFICGRELMKKGKIDTQLISKHLIRGEYGLYEKKYLLYINKSLVLGDHFNLENVVPDRVKMRVFHKKSVPKNRNYDKKIYKGETPECVKYLLSQDFSSLKDGRDRAFFFVTWWFRENSSSFDEWKFQVEKYNKYVLNGYFNKSIVNAKISYSNKNRDRNFSHKYVHRLLDELGVKHKCDMGDETTLKVINSVTTET